MSAIIEFLDKPFYFLCIGVSTYITCAQIIHRILKRYKLSKFTSYLLVGMFFVIIYYSNPDIHDFVIDNLRPSTTEENTEPHSSPEKLSRISTPESTADCVLIDESTTSENIPPNASEPVPDCGDPTLSVENYNESITDSDISYIDTRSIENNTNDHHIAESDTAYETTVNSYTHDELASIVDDSKLSDFCNSINSDNFFNESLFCIPGMNTADSHVTYEQTVITYTSEQYVISETTTYDYEVLPTSISEEMIEDILVLPSNY